MGDLLEASRGHLGEAQNPLKMRQLILSECGPARETSPLKWASQETCTSKNGKRVTEGAYSFAWDEERAGEGVREDETRSQRKNNNALPDSFLYESLEAREQDGITAGEPESMSA